MKTTQRQRLPRGFTLVELLVVLFIVAVLAIIGVQGYKAARTRGNQAASTTNIRNLAAANLLYATDYGTFCPAQDTPNLVRWHGARKSTKGEFDPTKGYLSEYLGDSRSVGICPEFKEHVSGDKSWEDGSGGYGYNEIYIGGVPNDWLQPNRPELVNNPGRTIMFASTALAKKEGVQEYPWAEPPQSVNSDWVVSGKMQPSLHFRFNGRALIAWCDGHVSEELPTSYPKANYYGGNNEKAHIGTCGPVENNGWWNPRN